MRAGKSAGGDGGERTIGRQTRRAGTVDGNSAGMRRTWFSAEKEKRKKKKVEWLRFIFCKQERA